MGWLGNKPSPFAASEFVNHELGIFLRAMFAAGRKSTKSNSNDAKDSPSARQKSSLGQNKPVNPTRAITPGVAEDFADVKPWKSLPACGGREGGEGLENVATHCVGMSSESRKKVMNPLPAFCIIFPLQFALRVFPRLLTWFQVVAGIRVGMSISGLLGCSLPTDVGILAGKCDRLKSAGNDLLRPGIACERPTTRQYVSISTYP